MQAPADHREGWYGLATCAERCAGGLSSHAMVVMRLIASKVLIVMPSAMRPGADSPSLSQGGTVGIGCRRVHSPHSRGSEPRGNAPALRYFSAGVACPLPARSNEDSRQESRLDLGRNLQCTLRRIK